MHRSLETDRVAGWLLAGAVGAAAFVVLVALGSGLTFFQDEWDLVLRPDWSADALLEPVNEHVWAAPIAIYKVLLAVFGMDSTAPFRVVASAMVVLVAALVFVIVKPRLGIAPALIAAALLALLGPAWEHLLWPVEIGFSGALAGGLGALLALQREDRRGDLWACALLVVALAFSSLGLVFAAGAAADVVLRGDDRLRRAFVPAVPVGLYVLWYAAYGHQTESAISADNLFALPLYVWSAASSAIASLAGLTGIQADSRSLGVSAEFGRPLLVAWLVLVGWAIARRPAVLSREFWVFAVSALAFWASAGINQLPGREAGASRYQLIGAVFIVLITSEVFRGTRPARGWIWAAAVLAAGSILSNVGALREGERFLRAQSDVHLASLAAIEDARDQLDPEVVFDPAVTGTPFPQPVRADDYFAAVDRWGSPVGEPESVLEGTEEARQDADSVLAAALGIGLQPLSAGSVDPDSATARCSRLDLDRSAGVAAVELGSGGLELTDADGGAAVRLRRWSESDYPVELGELAAGVTRLSVPSDESGRPWVAELAGSGSVGACAL